MGSTTLAEVATTIYDHAQSNGAFIDYSQYLLSPEGSETGNDSVITGKLTQNTVITTGSDLFVMGGIIVPEGITLTIEPGVRLRFPDDTGIRVEGQLILNGVENNRITLTSAWPDTIPGAWKGISLGENARLNGEHTAINYASRAIYSNNLSDGSVSISHFSFYNFSTAGIDVSNGDSVSISDAIFINEPYEGTAIKLHHVDNVSIEGNIIRGMDRGILLSGPGDIAINNNVISGNRFGVYLQGVISNQARTPFPSFDGNDIVDNLVAGIYLNSYGEDFTRACSH